MRHSVKVTALDKKCFPELQREYCADPQAGPCPCYHVGDEFLFRRDRKRDDFWHMGPNTLVKTAADPDTVAGGPSCPTARNYGTPSPGISTPGSRAAPS